MLHKAIALAALVLASTAVAVDPPPTAKAPVTDELHAVKIVDDYRWLEDWSQPKVKEWSEAQNAYARSVLDALPNTAPIRDRVKELLEASSVSYSATASAAGQVFAIKRQPPRQQPFLIVLPANLQVADERVVVDPNAIDPAGGTAIDWFVPSPDGSLVAVSMSQHGSEAGDVHVFDVRSGKRVHEQISRVNGGTAGGHLAWATDGSGFFYTRYPREGERPAEDMDFYVQVYFHHLGDDPAKDRYEIGKDFPRIAEIQLETVPGGDLAGAVLASVQKGDGGEFIHFLRAPDGAWKQFTRYEDRVVQAKVTPDGHAVLISRNGAPRGKVLLLDLHTLDLAKAETVVPEGPDVIVDEFFDASNLATASDRVYITFQLGGPSQVRAFGYDGKPRPSPTLAPVSGVGGLTLLRGGKLLLNSATYIAPPQWLTFDPAAPGDVTNTPLSSAFPFSFANYEVVRETATSKDGTKVPVNIIRRKGLKLDGSHPLLVTSYGGYGVNLEPRFRAGTLALLEQGFVWAEANIRGGGEFGEKWHTEGNLTRKQNVFDDFAAAIAYLHKAGYSTPARTAIEGGSNGGLLMGATMVQHPELVKCVVSHVGIYDMLRVELSPNGAFNVTEFGTVKDAAQFKALHAYSPYHHVKDGTKYPPVLFLTGANDPRVDPMQSRKMTARLQAVGATALLRTSAGSGHGMGTALSERVEQAVDANAFLFDQLGIRYSQSH
ncbi:prolyl oligopeptidase [Phycisphaerales bacterium]|nr:prolyl oligopeptidase [Phycisphaerales bacterium]